MAGSAEACPRARAHEGALRPRLHGLRARALCALLWLVLATGCGKGLAGALAPDFSGTWDITYDDSMEVEVQLGDHAVRDTVEEQGGAASFQDATLISQLTVDCARSELVCPSEVWPRELSLKHVPGRLDGDGTQLTQTLQGRGAGACKALAGSIVTGEVMGLASAHAIRQEAVALTAGRVRVVLDYSCFGAQAELPAGTRVVLSAGFSAAKR